MLTLARCDQQRRLRPCRLRLPIAARVHAVAARPSLRLPSGGSDGGRASRLSIGLAMLWPSVRHRRRVQALTSRSRIAGAATLHHHRRRRPRARPAVNKPRCPMEHQSLLRGLHGALRPYQALLQPGSRREHPARFGSFVQAFLPILMAPVTEIDGSAAG
jgi:hypothetical protein